MKNKIPLFTMLLAVLCVSLSPADGIAENPGFDDKEIRVAQFGPQTGPAAPWGAAIRRDSHQTVPPALSRLAAS